MKIVYCINSIRYLGGIQRATITKANALASIQGNEVYVVVTDNKDGILLQPLSENVHLIDLDINYYDGSRRRSKISNMIVALQKRRKHRTLLNEFLTGLNPDVVISVGTSEKYMLLTMNNRTWKLIREFHFDRNYRKRLAKTRFDKFIARFVDFYDFNFKEKKYDRIVVLSHEDKDTNWKGWNNVSVIHDPVPFHCKLNSGLDKKVITTLGRLEHEKNYSSLIRVFKIIAEKFPDWVLKIYGDGDERLKLQDIINEEGVTGRVLLMGTTMDAQLALRESSIFVLSSITEGFGMVLVEAMECGLPVVAYQCPCGPKDIISEGVDGFLVPLNDEKVMANRICQLIENEELRRKMGGEAKKKAMMYHIDIITNQWMNLFKAMLN